MRYAIEFRWKSDNFEKPSTTPPVSYFEALRLVAVVATTFAKHGLGEQVRLRIACAA